MRSPSWFADTGRWYWESAAAWWANTPPRTMRFRRRFWCWPAARASVRPREQVGNWLYGVAYRTALKARMVLARRRSREKQVDVMPEPTAPAAIAAADWSDLQVVIDEELAKLPDKLRLPVILCDLEGRPQREVAKHLNVAPATLATRLASARRTLAQRLTRRGVVLSGGAGGLARRPRVGLRRAASPGKRSDSRGRSHCRGWLPSIHSCPRRPFNFPKGSCG